MNVPGMTPLPDWCGDDDLRVAPFEALRVAYGMLLGEDDFRVSAGNPRGKQMLHAAWLHGAGVVQGLAVATEEEKGRRTLRVGAGLAIDGVGRELRVDGAGQCLDVGAWLDAQKAGGAALEPPIVTRLVLRFHACPTRPVPSLADPCDTERRHTDFSRLVETVRLDLRRGEYPLDPVPGSYHGLRVLLGLERCTGPGDETGLAALAELRTVRADPAAAVDAFRRVVARDVTALQAAKESDGTGALFPVPGDGSEVVLATVTITPHDGAPATCTVDPTTRRGLVATSTVLELVSALVPALLGRADPGGGGPRVVRSSVAWQDPSTITFEVTRPLSTPTLVREQVRVRSFGADGWSDEEIRANGLRQDEQDGRHRVRVALRRPPENGLVRLVVRGTGAEPVTDEDGIPLAGCDDGPPGTEHDGHDAVHQFPAETKGATP